jgi:hypothetical protein
VLEAVEKAVVALIVEGVTNGYWDLANPEDMKSAVIQNYLEEKRQQRSLDPAYVQKTMAGVRMGSEPDNLAAISGQQETAAVAPSEDKYKSEPETAVVSESKEDQSVSKDADSGDEQSKTSPVSPVLAEPEPTDAGGSNEEKARTVAAISGEDKPGLPVAWF